jgi:anti-anti-sigma regulatory factor
MASTKTKQQLIDALAKADQRIETLERNTSRRKARNEEISVHNEQMLSIFDGINEVIYVADPDTYELLFINKTVKDLFGDIVGQKCYQALQNLDAPCPFCTNTKIFGEYMGKSYIWEFQNKITRNWYRCIDKAIPWTDGRMVRFELASDVTDLKKAEERLAEQQKEILELSTPVIRIWKGIVVAPMVGLLDSQRTQQFMERFLDSIVSTNAAVALVDITGVPAVDTQTAQHLIESVNAARLLGAHVIITGISPAIAQTIVQLGVDLSDVTTCASLSVGLQTGLKILGLKITEVTGGDTGQSRLPI